MPLSRPGGVGSALAALVLDAANIPRATRLFSSSAWAWRNLSIEGPEPFVREHVWWFGGGGATLDLRRDMMIYRPIPRTKEDIRDVSHDRRSHWEDTAFFVGVLLLTAGGGLVVLAGLELPLAYAKLVWGGVGCVWGSVLIRVWIFNETRGR